jgi:hypothetical protein
VGGVGGCGLEKELMSRGATLERRLCGRTVRASETGISDGAGTAAHARWDTSAVVCAACGCQFTEARQTLVDIAWRTVQCDACCLWDVAANT